MSETELKLIKYASYAILAQDLKDLVSDINQSNTQKGLIIVNSIETPDGTILKSKHRHDFVRHEDSVDEIFIK